MKMKFETEDYIIILSDDKLEVDLKRGARAYVEHLFEGSRFYNVLKWFLSYIFPRDFYLDDIMDVHFSGLGELFIREKTPLGVKETKISGLSRVQAELLAKAIKSMIEKSKLKLLTK
ncbi:MAG TPA: hypothetical protein ENG81_01630 [Candidatus Bathyarchaeota archaeon]|nr:MAG: hypothetical protein DRJ30_05595 [Candidatus Verstraetearchaeota archaeon]HDO20211.1 hypothetical protein [Candidatus Bathyarchaeota archaeon]